MSVLGWAAGTARSHKGTRLFPGRRVGPKSFLAGWLDFPAVLLATGPCADGGVWPDALRVDCCSTASRDVIDRGDILV